MSKGYVRIGKTARDRASGATARRLSNMSARVAWQKDPKNNPFPITACNGKKNRHRYMKAGGIQVS